MRASYSAPPAASTTPPSRARLPALLLALGATIVAAAWPDASPTARDSADLLPDRSRRAAAHADPPTARTTPTTGDRTGTRPINAAAFRSPINEEGTPTLFGSLSTAQAALRTAAATPPPPPASAPEVPVISSPVVAKGLLRERGRAARALLEAPDGEIVVLSAGQPIDPAWMLETVRDHEIVLLHRPTQDRRVLTLPTEP